MKKVILKSNFHDYYDSWLDIQLSPYEEVFVLERFSNRGMNRKEMFDFLKNCGYPTPDYGIPENFKEKVLKNFSNMKFEGVVQDKILDFYDVVVYTDLMSHCGEGKLKVSLSEALRSYPECLCSDFLRHCVAKYPGYSIRVLNVGNKSFLIEYRSSDSWKSNCGEVEVTLLDSKTREDLKNITTIDIPLYAIDFVPTEQGLIAVDFNIAPQVDGTGIENIYTGRELAGFIKEFMNGKEGIA